MKNMFNEIIHLTCFYGPEHNGARIYPVRNPLTGEYPECVRKVTSSNDIIYKNTDNPGDYYVKETDSIFVKQGSSFDLDNDIQRKQWEAIKFSDLIFDSKGKYDEDGNEISAPSEHAPANAIFYVVRQEDEVKKKNQASRLKNKALNFIYQDSDTGLALKAKVLGSFVKDSTREEIEDYVVSLAMKDPQRVINLYTGSDMKLHLVFLEAKDKHILLNKGGIFVYGDSNIIGRTEDDCVNYFKQPENKLITDRIIKEVTEALKEKEKINIDEYAPEVDDKIYSVDDNDEVTVDKKPNKK